MAARALGKAALFVLKVVLWIVRFVVAIVLDIVGEMIAIGGRVLGWAAGYFQLGFKQGWEKQNRDANHVR